jgi:hypothetical protein
VTQFRRVLGRCAIGAVLLFLAGCRVDARVDIALEDDGSGTVTATLTFDREAMARLGGRAKAAQQVPLGDLRDAGWQISSWTPGPRGTTTLTLTQEYADQDELARLLADLTGADGALRTPTIERERGWFTSRDSLSLVVDMRALESGVVGDAELRARLEAAGLDPTTLDSQLTRELRDSFHLTVAVQLPGGEVREYDATVGTEETVAAEQDHTDYDRMVQLGLAVALAVLAALFLASAAVSARRNRRRRRERVHQEERIERKRAPTM